MMCDQSELKKYLAEQVCVQDSQLHAYLSGSAEDDVVRHHADGSICEAKSDDTCPKVKKAEKADRLTARQLDYRARIRRMTPEQREAFYALGRINDKIRSMRERGEEVPDELYAQKKDLQDKARLEPKREEEDLQFRTKRRKELLAMQSPEELKLRQELRHWVDYRKAHRFEPAKVAEAEAAMEPLKEKIRDFVRARHGMSGEDRTGLPPRFKALMSDKLFDLKQKVYATRDMLKDLVKDNRMYENGGVRYKELMERLKKAEAAAAAQQKKDEDRLNADYAKGVINKREYQVNGFRRVSAWINGGWKVIEDDTPEEIKQAKRARVRELQADPAKKERRRFAGMIQERKQRAKEAGVPYEIYGAHYDEFMEETGLKKVFPKRYKKWLVEKGYMEDPESKLTPTQRWIAKHGGIEAVMKSLNAEVSAKDEAIDRYFALIDDDEEELDALDELDEYEDLLWEVSENEFED